MKLARCSVRAAASAALITLVAAGQGRAFDAQLFSPAVDPQGYYSVYSSRTTPAGRFHLGLWHNWADDPVILRPTDGVNIGRFSSSDLSATTRVVDRLHTLDFVASYSVTDWLELGIDIPVSDIKTEAEGFGIEERTGIDDIRLLGKFQILDNRSAPVGFGLVPFVDVPTGDEDRLTANDDVDYGVLAVADTIYKRFRTSVNFGYKVNDKAFDDGDESDELLFGLGAGVLALKDYPILFGIFDNLEVMGEVFGATAEQNVFDDEFLTPLEGLGGVRLYSKGGLYFTAGIGESITDSINGSSVRVVSSIAYTPPPPPPPPPAPAPPPPPPPPPPTEGVVVTDEQIVTLEPIYFDFDKDTIKPVSYPILDSVAQVMADRPDMVVRVEGHTDSFGSDAYNQDLSERRAHSVVRYLIGKGVASERLQAVGYGESRPIATNDTSEGRAKNRRTEFHIVAGGSGVTGGTASGSP